MSEREIVLHGCVTTKKNVEDFIDDFLGWLESRSETFGGGIHEYSEENAENRGRQDKVTSKRCMWCGARHENGSKIQKRHDKTFSAKYRGIKNEK